MVYIVCFVVELCIEFLFEGKNVVELVNVFFNCINVFFFLGLDGGGNIEMGFEILLVCLFGDLEVEFWVIDK